MKVFNLKKIFLSSVMFLSILSCNNIFAMRYMPSVFTTKYVDGTKVKVRDLDNTAGSFSKNAFECLVANLEGLHQYGGFSEYIFNNQDYYKDLFARSFIQSFTSQDPSIISRLFEKGKFLEELKINLSDKMARDLIHLFQIGVCQSSPDRWAMIESDPKFRNFTEEFKKIILESFEKMAQNSWGFNKIMQKASAGTKFTANATAFTGMLVGLFIVYEAYSLINKGYYKEGLAIITFIGLVYVVLSKTQHVFNGAVRPLVRQGQQVYNDGHALLYGQERRPEIEEVLRRIAREEADKKR